MTKSNIGAHPASPVLGITLDGVCTWQLLESNKVVQQSTQHNLLLDSGLDNIGIYGLVDPYKYACVGTGTSEPNVTQSALDAEAARTLSRPSAATDSPQYQNPGLYVLTLEREFSEASVANKNLTEWGFSPVSQGGVGVRERFRDDNGDPVTLTPDGSQKLKLTYEVSVTLSPADPQAFSFEVTGAGAATSAGSDTLSGSYRLLRPFGSGQADFNVAEFIAKGLPLYIYLGNYNNGTIPAYNGRSGNDFQNIQTSPQPYVAGSFERSCGSATVGTQDAVGTVREVALRFSANDFKPGYIAILEENSAIQKDNLHTLTIEGPVISWSRANG